MKEYELTDEEKILIAKRGAGDYKGIERLTRKKLVEYMESKFRGTVYSIAGIDYLVISVKAWQELKEGL